ncbi:hypothetical protein ACOMHN_043418 [Nucella lapillus]
MSFEMQSRQRAAIRVMFITCIVFSCLLLVVTIGHSLTYRKHHKESTPDLVELSRDAGVAHTHLETNVGDQTARQQRVYHKKDSKPERTVTEDFGQSHGADFSSGSSLLGPEKHLGNVPPPRSANQQSFKLFVPSMSSLLTSVFEKRPSISERRFMSIMSQMEVLPEDVNMETYKAYLNKIRNRSNDLMPRLLIGQEAGCDERPPFLLVLVPSVASHVAIRQAIRDTWASPYFRSWPGGVYVVADKVKVVFVFGVTSSTDDVQQLGKEERRYGDIVQYDFKDSYRNLTLKMAAAFRWTRQFCPLTKFILKVDEDTMVNFPVLIRLRHVLSARSARFILEHAIPAPLPMRHGKWKVSHEEYPYHKYPPYVLDYSYVLTGSVVGEAAAQSLQLRPSRLLPMEDVFFTGLLASVLHVQRLHSPAFALGLTHVPACRIVQGAHLTLTHFSDPRALRSVWVDAQRGMCGVLPAAWRRRGRDTMAARVESEFVSE